MSRRSRLIGLAIATALLANGLASHALAGWGLLRPVKACEPVQQVPACKPVHALPLPPACKPVRPLPLLRPASRFIRCRRHTLARR